MRDLLWDKDAWEEYESIQDNVRILKRVNKLLKDILRNGYNATYGKIEMLTGDLQGYASVRIDSKNRIVFRADQNTVTVIQCGGHYSDK